jgi:hypothetical protein
MGSTDAWANPPEVMTAPPTAAGSVRFEVLTLSDCGAAHIPMCDAWPPSGGAAVRGRDDIGPISTELPGPLLERRDRFARARVELR